MLRAASEKDGTLELIRLTLQLVQRHNEDDITSDLKSYFVRVITEAKQISSDPGTVTSDILPESIELALRMKRYIGLSQEFEKVNNIDAVSPELAGTLLRKMENQPVYSHYIASAS